MHVIARAPQVARGSPVNQLRFAFVTEDRLACIASHAQMVDGVFKFYGKRLYHFFRVEKLIASVKYLDLNPDLFLLISSDYSGPLAAPTCSPRGGRSLFAGPQ